MWNKESGIYQREAVRQDEIDDLTTAAKARTEASDTRPTQLGQLIAAVEYLQSGKPVGRNKKTLDQRLEMLQTKLTELQT